MSRSIAFVLPSLAGGGAERVTLTLLEGARALGWEPVLLVCDAKGPLAEAIPAGIEVVDLGLSRLRQALPALVARLRRLTPTVTFSSLGYLNVSLAALRPFLPGRLVVREANLPSLSLPRSPFPRLLPLTYHLFYRHADTVLSTSRRMAEEMAQFGIPQSRLRLLPNPVDVQAIRRRAADPLRVGGDGVRLVTAGRLVHQKGFDRVIPLLAATPGAHLTILGDGPERAALAGLAAQHGVRVDLPGFVADAPRWYAGADAVVLPSRWEGMPNVALEALACGTPVIATPEAGGIAELAEDTPAGALTVRAADDDFLAPAGELRHDGTLRPSLLPPPYESAAVAKAFAGILDEVCHGRR